MNNDKENNIIISYFVKGKVSIPKNIARSIDLNESDIVTVTVKDNSIVIKKFPKEKIKEVML